MSKYEEFQEWLNECPVKITRYEDFTDFFEVTFDVVDDEVEEVEQCVIDTNGDSVSYTHLTLPTIYSV